MANIIAAIAERAGVSPSTVTRILNGKANYNRPFYRQRADHIRQLAEELHYQPNLAAQAISTGRFQTICLVSCLSDLGGLPPDLVDGISEGASEHDHLVSLARLPDSGFTEAQRLPRMLRSNGSDGLLIHYPHSWPDGLFEDVGNLTIPAVWLNVRLPNNCLHCADYEAARDTTRHFIELGHHDIALVHPRFDPAKGGKHVHYAAHDRWAGYRSAMTAAGLEPWLVAPQAMDGNLIKDPAIQRLFKGNRKPTALLVTDAGEAVICAASQYGFRLAQNMSLCCFTQGHTAAHSLPCATLTAPYHELGSASVDYLLHCIEGDGVLRKPRAIPIPLRRQEFLRPPSEPPSSFIRNY